MDERSDPDVIIIGSGLAGAAAAYQLSQQGIRCLLLEARARSGGRAYARRFRGESSADLLEYGGSWITPWHHRIRSLCGLMGLSLRPRSVVTERLAMRDRQAGHLQFEDDAERREHERVLTRIAADAVMLKTGHDTNERGETLTGISYSQYMQRLKPPAVTRHLQDAWCTVSGGGKPNEISASEFLHSCSYAGGIAERMIDVWSDTVEPSMDALADALIKASGARLVHSCPAAQVRQEPERVVVSSADGHSFAAPYAIIATGINPMASISFSPPLRDLQQKAVLRGHAGRAFKLWIKARGVPVGRIATGDGSGIQLLFAERSARDGTTLLIGFGVHDEAAAPADEAWVRAQFARLAPNAEFLGSDWHDWSSDEFSRGTWVSTPHDMAQPFTSKAWEPLGRVAFASSDFAPEEAGWFEGAVRSGEAAAAWVASQKRLAGFLSL